MASLSAGMDVPKNMGVETGNVIAKVSPGFGDGVSVIAGDEKAAGEAVVVAVAVNVVVREIVSVLGEAQLPKPKEIITSMAKTK
jgi:hypothetical protein